MIEASREGEEFFLCVGILPKAGSNGALELGECLDCGESFRRVVGNRHDRSPFIGRVFIPGFVIAERSEFVSHYRASTSIESILASSLAASPCATPST